MSTARESFPVSIQMIVDKGDLPALLALQARVRGIYQRTLMEVSKSIRGTEKIKTVQEELDTVTRAVQVVMENTLVHS